MDAVGLAIVALFVLAFTAVSGLLTRSVVTPPMVFVLFGLVVGPGALGVVDLDVDRGALRTLAEATLVLALFTDAARIDLKVLRREFRLPARLLGIGFPLTIVAGGLGAAALFDGFGLWEAALVGAVLAPTDAALGHAVVSAREVPVRIRQALNVESGLNDGIALPVIAILLALAGAGEHLRSASFWAVFALKQVGFGLLVGAGIGYLGGRLIDGAARRGWLAGTFLQLATLAVGVAAFALAETLDGNGFIAAFTSGMVFGAVARPHCHGIYAFAVAEGQLLVLLTFMVFGGAVVGRDLGRFTWQMGAYAALSLTVIRAIPVALALARARLRRHTVAFLAWFGPRGLASILFGLFIIEEAGITAAGEILPIVTLTVLASVFAHGLTALPAARAYARHIHRGDKAEMPEHEEATDLPTRVVAGG